MEFGADIRFPHLGITLNSVGTGITISGFTIAYYGIIVATAMAVGLLIARIQAKRTGQDKDIYLDLALYDIVFAVIGARIYYVLFSFSDYKDNLLEIFNIRAGGLAIYGGVIGGAITTYIFVRIKKLSFPLVADTACAGLIAGQAIGRWGNFFNREAFGGYTDSLFAMQIRKTDVHAAYITEELNKHLVKIDGIEYIQVHPTFLYESLWNLLILVLILVVTRYKKYDGQLACIYFAGYGLGRLFIEGLRTDQLHLPGTEIAVSQLLALLCVLAFGGIMIWKAIRVRKAAQSG